ncbi:MAG: helicase C-terminal domain-containing protein [Candidatus Bipolaricaulota bacterium]|nr:helicase C-terminal domain-containing protein [Candidatus Bipolaricaulota bacterium]
MGNLPSVEDEFSVHGVIGAGLPDYEDRPGQREMARFVSQALKKEGTLVVEAGPGTGKSFAYIIPVILHLCSDPSARAVISTRTKQLQEQLYRKDIPFLRSHLAPELKVAMLKGRENYLCLDRWYKLVGGLPSQGLPSGLSLIADWLSRTQTGDIEENSEFLSHRAAGRLWPRLRTDPRHCPGSSCPFFNECFSMIARRRAKRAALVIVNHSLLLADLGSEHGILGDYRFLVVDEAHALEETTREAFTSSLSQRSLNALSAEIYRPTGDSWGSRLSFPSDDQRIARLHSSIVTLRSLNARIFSSVAGLLPGEQRGRLPRLNGLDSQLKGLLQRIGDIEISTEGILDTLDVDDQRREGERLIMELEAIGQLFKELFGAARENYVNWYSRDESGVTLKSSPLKVDKILQDSLYPDLDGLILTSATLSLDGDFSYLRDSLGLSSAPGEVKYSVVKSPFLYDRWMRIYLPEFLPSVNSPIDSYAEGLASLISKTAAQTNRKQLVLFTSYRLLQAVKERVAGDVLVQSENGSRSGLMERFKRSDGGTILLGTDSFWEGVDLPGEALEILVITRLPFPVPTDPVFSAIGERLAQEGKNPFLQLAVPRAVLKLRQGMGRLIRTKRDRGAIIVTDSRILHRSYGQRFLASFPVAGIREREGEGLLRDLVSWFDFISIDG